MAGGLLGAGQYYRQSAGDLFSAAAREENTRNDVNRGLKTQDVQSGLGTVGAGVGMGFAVGGPIGAGVGAALGLGAQLLSKKLF